MGNDKSNVKFAIETREFDGNWSEARKNAYATDLRDFKHCANYCRTIIEDVNNIRYNADASPRWTFEKLEVLDNKYPLIWLDKYGGRVLYNREVLGPETFGPALYIVTTMVNAVNAVKSEANREMTPAEIEAEFNLNRGVVRKYIHDHESDLVALEVIRKADARTWLCKRGWAINRWGQK